MTAAIFVILDPSGGLRALMEDRPDQSPGPDPPEHNWQFPGGKLEPGESSEEAARREVTEELDCAVAAIERLGDPFVHPQHEDWIWEPFLVRLKADCTLPPETFGDRQSPLEWKHLAEVAVWDRSPSARGEIARRALRVLTAVER